MDAGGTEADRIIPGEGRRRTGARPGTLSRPSQKIRAQGGAEPGKDPAMPRESTQQSARQEAARSTLDMEITHRDRTVWVSLSGILDRPGLDAMLGRIALKLGDRGRRIVLDGSGLIHMDYRCTGPLLAWNRTLKQYGHQLYLRNWSDYLKAILVMEDWDRELGAPEPGLAIWRRPATALDVTRT